MSINAVAVRTAIIEAMEAAGSFAHGYFEGQPAQATGAKAVQGDYVFDVVLSPARRSASSNVIAGNSRRLLELDVRIPIVARLPTAVQGSERRAVLAAAEAACATAARALSQPGALSFTSADEATRIAGGVLTDRDGRGEASYAEVRQDGPRSTMRFELRGMVTISADDASPPINAFFGDIVEYWDSTVGYALSDGDVDTWTGQYAGIVLAATSAAQRATFNESNAYFNGSPSIDMTDAPTKLRAIDLDLDLDPGDTLYMALVARRIVDTRVVFQCASGTNVSSLHVSGRTVPAPFYGQFKSVEVPLGFDINLASASPAEPHLFEAWYDGTHARAAIDGVEGTAVLASGIGFAVSRISLGSQTGASDFSTWGEFEIRLAVVARSATVDEITAFRAYAAGLHV